MRQAEIYSDSVLAGVLTETDEGTYRFRYDDAFLADDKQTAISLSFPKSGKEFASETLFPFFYNMLNTENRRRGCVRIIVGDGTYRHHWRHNCKEDMKALTVCPGHLAEGFEKYCPSCTRRLFDGKRVSPQLDFDYDADSSDMAENINQLSVSGVQEKLSAIVADGKIVLTPAGGQGRYIIKPAPAYKHLRFRDQIPANEHLTMQIARQVYKIPTAENGLVFFKNGEAARAGFQIYGQLRRCRRSTESKRFGVAGADESLFRARSLQLPLCQRRRAPEELFATTNARRRLSARTRLRSIEHFDPCRRRKFRPARRPDSRGGVFRCLYANGASLSSRFRDLRTTDRRVTEEDDGDSRVVRAGTAGGLCFNRPLFPRRKSQADVQTVVSGAVEPVEERGIECTK